MEELLASFKMLDSLKGPDYLLEKIVWDMGVFSTTACFECQELTVLLSIGKRFTAYNIGLKYLW